MTPKINKPPPLPVSVTAAEIAGLLGIAERTVRERAQAGDLIKDAKNNYLLKESIQCYIHFMTSKKVGGDSESDLEVQKTRKTRSEADIAEIEAALLQGKVVETEAVKELWTDLIFLCRNRILGIPSQIAARMPAEHAVEALEFATTTVHEALEELGNYSPKKIDERTDRKRLFGASKRDDDDAVASSSEAYDEPMG